MTTPFPQDNLALIFHDGTHPSISLSVFMDGDPTPRTINVAGTQFGNVVLGGAASFGLSPVESTRAGRFGVLSVFPTPTDGKVTLQVNLPQFASLTVSVTDVNGRLLQVSDMELGQGLNEVQVDLTRFAAGTYFVKLDNGETQLTEQIVKQ
ncbi:MAG: T9SS type A sorting domain-containing protein [Saprospiraceae bacterium]|nr:T9SS type A sorting domain-containing protein [Saprospiraceae bacterium]